MSVISYRQWFETGRTRSQLQRGLASGELRRIRRGIVCDAFADADAESPGESLSRVRMWQAGLVMPELQHVVTDAFDRFVARTDFYWKHCRAVGEFDGEVKYGDLAAERGVAAVVMDEKRRQAQIEDQGLRVIRWTWQDIVDGTMVRRLRPIVGESR